MVHGPYREVCTIDNFELKNHLVVEFGKGQIISKLFLVSSISSKKRTKISRHSSKKNSFVCFLEEFEDAKNHFEIN